MSDDFDKLFQEIHELVTAQFEDRLGPEGHVRLESLISTDPAARRLYLEYVGQTASLRWWAGAAGKAEPPPTDEQDDRTGGPQRRLLETESMILPALKDGDRVESAPTASFASARPETERRRWPYRRIAAMVLVPLVLGLALYGLLRRPALTATLAAVVDAEWGEPPGGLRPGEAPPSTPLYLKSGIVQMRFKSGVSMILEGPVRFTIRSDALTELATGKLAVTVPPNAIGFSVQTPVAKVIDQGTEFGVEVRADGSTSTEVFRGKVRAECLHAPASGQMLTAGEAADVNSGGSAVQPIAFQPLAFVREDELATREKAAAGPGYNRWLASDIALRRDPALIALYTFDNAAEAPLKLLNRAATGSSLDGVLVARRPQDLPRWTSGRWPWKGALEFPGTGDSRVEVPPAPLDFSRGTQTASPFTVLTWVLVRQPQPAFSTVFSHGRSFHEQYALDICDGGYRAWVRCAPTGEDPPPGQCVVPVPPYTSWQQLAMVYDPSSGMVSLYVNGKLAGPAAPAKRTLIQTSDPVTFGFRASGQYATGLNGRIDELAIVRRALSASEIRELFDAGNP